MSGAEIAGLLIRFGPIALDWIHELSTIWSKQLTPEEVQEFVKGKRKSYDEYIAAERASRATGAIT
jgi:hypothetical protein